MNQPFYHSNSAMHQIMNIKQVSAVLGLSRSTIYEMINPKSKYFDPTFPKQIKLTLNRIGWVSSEVNAWIEDQMLDRK